jgi:hypothetical protein
MAGAYVVFPGFFGKGFFVGTGSEPFAVKTLPAALAVNADFKPIAPTRIAIARAMAPSLRDICASVEHLVERRYSIL